MKGVQVDLSVVVIRWVIFGLDYIAPTGNAECGQRLRFVQHKCVMRDVYHRRQRLDLEI